MSNVVRAAAFISMLVLGVLQAQYGSPNGTGSSTITFQLQNVTVAQGGSLGVGYTVSLSGGNYGKTHVTVVNNAELLADKIDVFLSYPSGYPTFSGQATITVGNSTFPMSYNVILNASGNDPAANATLELHVVPAHKSNNNASSQGHNVIEAPHYLTLYSYNTLKVNTATGGTVNVKAPDGSEIEAVISPGTYAELQNETKLLSEYNFTIATFKLSSGFPAPNSTMFPLYGLAFEVDGEINSSISFVNSTGGEMPIATIAPYPETWTTWALLGGSFNGTTYGGGNYTSENKWVYNASSGTITNTQFAKPVIWIFQIRKQNTNATAAENTSKAKPVIVQPQGHGAPPLASYAVIVGIIAAIIIIGAVIIRSKKKVQYEAVQEPQEPAEGTSDTGS